VPNNTEKLFWKRLQVVILISGIITANIWFSLRWQYMETRPNVMQPASGNVFPLHSGGLVVYITKTDKHRLEILYYGGGLFGLSLLLIHFLKRPFETDLKKP
jgi:hypothetical protein